MKYYVSVTGLQLKGLWYLPKFMKHAVQSTMQAQASQGNVSTRTNLRNGVRHTLTVWDNKTSMLRYMRAGAHAQAMRINNEISLPGKTKVYGYESDTIPTWDEAIALWEVHGTRHGKVVKQQQQSAMETTKSPLYGTKMVALLTIGAIVAVVALTDPSTLFASGASSSHNIASITTL
jgi:hypothetical protein